MLKGLLHSSLIRTAGIYTLSSGLNGAIPFLLLPVLTRYLSPEDYGTMAMFSMLVSINSCLAGLSIHGSIFNKYFERDQIDLGSYIGNCFLVLVFSSLVTAGLLLLFSDYVFQFTEFPSTWLWSVIAVSSANFIISAQLNLWQARSAAYKFASGQILLTLTNVCFSVFFVVQLQMNWQGRVLAQVISTSILAFICFWTIHKSYKISFKIHKPYIQGALSFGVPLIPHGLGALFITATDRFLITNMVNIGETGLYAVSLQIGMVFSFMTESFNKAYAPWLYERLKKNESTNLRKIVHLTYGYFFIVLTISLIPAFLPNNLISLFLGSRFADAQKFFGPLFLGLAFNGMYYMVCNYIFYSQKTKYLALVTFFSGTLNIGMSYVFIQNFGAVGAAYGTCISFAISFVLTWILAQKVHPMPWLQALLPEKKVS